MIYYLLGAIQHFTHSLSPEFVRTCVGKIGDGELRKDRFRLIRVIYFPPCRKGQWGVPVSNDDIAIQRSANTLGTFGRRFPGFNVGKNTYHQQHYLYYLMFPICQINSFQIPVLIDNEREHMLQI